MSDIEINDADKVDDDTHKDDDLAECAAKFGEQVIAFARDADADHVTAPLISQLVESAARIGAKFFAAKGMAGKPEFAGRISACIEEVETTKYWIRMVTTSAPDLSELGRTLWKEAHELGLAFETLRRYDQRRAGSRET
ncbi:MAG: hypothetical protein ACR2NU_16480 [Aeoliella sp.]